MTAGRDGRADVLDRGFPRGDIERRRFNDDAEIGVRTSKPFDDVKGKGRLAAGVRSRAVELRDIHSARVVSPAVAPRGHADDSPVERVLAPQQLATVLEEQSETSRDISEPHECEVGAEAAVHARPSSTSPTRSSAAARYAGWLPKPIRR